MSILQFLRILWARRLVIGVAVISCVLGAVIVILVVPARWEGHSRVMLDLIKPDPVTGVIVGANSRAYANTQIELIKDYSVASRVADQLGWVSDPALVQQFQQSSAGDSADFKRWLAQLIIDRTQVKLLEGSNILEITYAASRPEDARTVADALMKAYVDTSVAFRREEAARNADWFDTQAQQAKTALDQASAAEGDFERQNNIVLADDKTDVDSARLHALAAQTGSGGSAFAPAPVSAPSSAELAQVEASIAQDTQSLGPNHPELVQLRARQATLKAQVAREQAEAAGFARTAASAAGAQSGQVEREMAAEKARVVGESSKLERLRQLQSDVDLRRDQFNKTSARAAELHQEANVAETGLTVLSAAVTPDKPAFPNKPLIAGGAIGLGLGMGVFVALLIELFSRRVRSTGDLESSTGTTVLAVVPPGPNPPKRSRRPLEPRLAGARRRRSAAKPTTAGA